MLMVFISTAVLGLCVFIVGWYKQIDIQQIKTRCIYNAMAGVNYALYQYRNSVPAPSGPIPLDANNNFTVSIDSGGGGGGDASAIIIDATDSDLSSKNEKIINWTIRNNSASEVTIDQVTITWNKHSKTLESLVIDGDSIWQGKEEISPAVFSVHLHLEANHTYAQDNEVKFDSSISGDRGVTLAFRMTDHTYTTGCIVYPHQTSTCEQGSCSLTIRSMGQIISLDKDRADQYRSVQAIYNTTTGKISSYEEISQTVP